jgi:putative ABC transport system permease protein
LTGNHWTTTYELVGESSPRLQHEWPIIPTRAVTPGYFETMGIPLFEGRTFRDSDRWDEVSTITNVPWVVVVNEAFVEQRRLDGSAIGRKLKFGNVPDHTAEIIGVVSNSRSIGLDKEPSPELYYSMWQHGPFTKHLVVRTTAEPGTMIGAIREALRRVEPTVAIENIRTMEELRDDSMESQVFIARMLVGLSLAASLLVGVYDVVAHSVNSRRRELAIRIALGATPPALVILTLRDILLLTMTGLLPGLVVALILFRLLGGYVFGVAWFDPVALTIGIAGAVAISILAAALPVRQVIKTEPMTILRGT